MCRKLLYFETFGAIGFRFYTEMGLQGCPRQEEGRPALHQGLGQALREAVQAEELGQGHAIHHQAGNCD